MKITLGKLKKLIHVSVRQPRANPLDSSTAKKKMKRAGAVVEETLEALANELGISVEAIVFGQARTPVGLRMMAGASNTLTHFFDPDDDWQKMPQSYKLV